VTVTVHAMTAGGRERLPAQGVSEMSIRATDRIPDDVLLLLETSVDEWIDVEDDLQDFRRVLDHYRAHVGTASEPACREALALAYLELIPSEEEGMLDPSQRAAINRCAEGLPYTEPAE
jgi:hypothetical protein